MVEYFEDTHQYLVDGVLVPSVSNLVAYATGNIYRDVPKHILDASAELGTRIHEAIESFEKGEEVTGFEENFAVWGWIDTKTKNMIEVIDMEQIVNTQDYAGRYDMLATVNGEESLIDIKTTSKLHERNLSIQMGLYLHAMGKTLPCYCLWIPKGENPNLIPVTPISHEECEELVNAYKTHSEPPRATNELMEVELYTPEETAKIKAFYALKEEVDKIDKVAKERAIAYMEEKGIKSYDNGDFKVTYIPPTTKKVVDADALKKDGIYDKYLKDTQVKASVRITWRKVNEQ